MAKQDFMTGIKKVSSQIPNSTFSEIERIKKQIIILDELKRFISPLTEEELKMLEGNLLKQGCKDPLSIWETSPKQAGTGESEETIYVLIDGHNRFSVCEKHKIDFKITLLQFEGIEQVKDYMIDFQLGRRNLSTEQMSYFRGLRYNRQKGEKGRYDRVGETENVSKRLAEEFQVSEKTIKNDGNFAAGIEKLTQIAQQHVLSGKTKINKASLQELGKREDIKVGNIESVEQLETLIQNETPKSKMESTQSLKAEIAKMIMNFSSKSDYDLIIGKLKILKKLL